MKELGSALLKQTRTVDFLNRNIIDLLVKNSPLASDI